jgi:hypothetical protein
MFDVHKALCTCAVIVLCSGVVRADDAHPSRKSVWQGSYLARVQALALLQSLNADLLSHDSATLTLEHWCDVHHLASPPRIVAERMAGMDKAPTPEQRRELDVTPTDAVRYRKVRLMCGSVVLSEADNWYVPGRLTAEMNRQLDNTELPFGKVVQALHFRRHTLSSKLLWAPLPEGWEMQPTGAFEATEELTMPSQVLEHRALLSLPDGTPFSEVVEIYSGNILAFPQPVH